MVAVGEAAFTLLLHRWRKLSQRIGPSTLSARNQGKHQGVSGREQKDLACSQLRNGIKMLLVSAGSICHIIHVPAPEAAHPIQLQDGALNFWLAFCFGEVRIAPD
jgi:hypothetical protein